MPQRKNALSNAQSASCVVSRYKNAYSNTRPDFQALKRAHSVLEAEVMTMCAIDPNDWDDALDKKFDAVVDRHGAALDALLMTPAKTQLDLREKLRVFAAHDIAKRWHLGAEIADLLARDAERLLKPDCGVRHG